MSDLKTLWPLVQPSLPPLPPLPLLSPCPKKLSRFCSLQVKSLQDDSWTSLLFKDFRKRFAALLGFQLRSLESKLASNVIVNSVHTEVADLTLEHLQREFNAYDVKRLEQYCGNLADYHLVMDMIPTLAKWFFLGQMGAMHLSLVQQCILLAVGLQHRTIEDIAKDLDIDRVQCLGEHRLCSAAVT